MTRASRAATIVRNAAFAIPLFAASCASLASNTQGPLQPQSVSGPCHVKRFFILGFTAVHTDLAIDSSGQACSMTIFNPDLQLTLSAALVTSQPAHGQATAQLAQIDRQAAITYAAQPGYTGPDRFTVTIEPGDRAIDFAVNVVPPGEPPQL